MIARGTCANMLIVQRSSWTVARTGRLFCDIKHQFCDVSENFVTELNLLGGLNLAGRDRTEYLCAYPHCAMFLLCHCPKGDIVRDVKQKQWYVSVDFVIELNTVGAEVLFKSRR